MDVGEGRRTSCVRVNRWIRRQEMKVWSVALFNWTPVTRLKLEFPYRAKWPPTSLKTLAKCREVGLGNSTRRANSTPVTRVGERHEAATPFKSGEIQSRRCSQKPTTRIFAKRRNSSPGTASASTGGPDANHGWAEEESVPQGVVGRRGRFQKGDQRIPKYLSAL